MLLNIFNIVFGLVLLFCCFVLIITKCWAEGNPKAFSAEELKENVKPLWVGSMFGFGAEFMYVTSFGLAGGIFAGLIIMISFAVGYYVYKKELKEAVTNERRS